MSEIAKLIIGKKSEYEVGKVVFENDDCRVRVCRGGDSPGYLDREFLLQVSKTPGQNHVVQTNCGTLLSLKRKADSLEKQFKAEFGRDGNLNYHFGFPELHESFYLHNGRQVNVISFRNVPEVGRMVPIVKLWKDGLRVDICTSAWMLGKLLKNLAFVHDQDVEIVKISGGNILIEPDEHYISIWDWSYSCVHGGGDGTDPQISHEIQVAEIKKTARCIIRVLGDDLKEAEEDDLDEEYISHLQALARGDIIKASKAHAAHYEIVDYLCGNHRSHWEKGFHKFTTKARKNQ